MCYVVMFDLLNILPFKWFLTKLMPDRWNDVADYVAAMLG